MILIPAIDIRDGRAVRLRQGDFDQETVYEAEPLRAARAFVDAGARALHVVDLDGARSGEPTNLEHVRAIAREAGVPVQVGGGLRSLDAVRATLDAGAARVVLGTAAFSDVDLLDEAVGAFASRVMVSIDVRGGHVATAGWTESAAIEPEAAIARLQDRGVQRFVYTNVERDGMLGGPDLDEVARIGATVRGRFLYSAGIGTLEHLRALVALRQVNLDGVIVGKALYERRFTVAEGQTALSG